MDTKKYLLSEILSEYTIERIIFTDGTIQYIAKYDGKVLTEFTTSLHNYENLSAMDEMGKYVLHRDIKRLFNISEDY